MTTLDTDMERLETILRELKEAVVVCDPNARILLYNSTAKRLFRNFEAMGLGQSLYAVCTRAPIEHTLQMLRQRTTNNDPVHSKDTYAWFVCTTVDGSMLLHCHINKVTFNSDQEGVFVFSFLDVTRQTSETGKQGYLLDKMIKDLRAPLTNLNIAAENLKVYPHMEPEVRSNLEDVIIRESAELTRRFESVVQESNKISNFQWPLFDVYSADIIGCLVKGFEGEEGVTITMTGAPLWLHADSYSLILVLDSLVRFVQKYCNVSKIDIEALLGDRRVYIDIVWEGEPIPQADVDSMLDVTLPDTASVLSVADVLSRHDSEMWSQEHSREGYSLLRIPVPDSSRMWEKSSESLQERSDFYDFSIAECSTELGEMTDQPLSCLNYVVFDTETTGLKPSQGDEILSIAAVRIVNRRILSGERFEHFIRPLEPIPESSLPFLEITEEMVQNEPPVQVVLPQFKSFVNDAVLVAHNGGFDMNFFQRMEKKSGVRFENPIIDTLLLALLIDKGRTAYTLENIGGWLNIPVTEARTVMGDCFVTAQIFLKLLDLLEEQGIKTLGQVIAATANLVEERRQ